MREKVLRIYKQILQSSRNTFGEDTESLNKVVQNIRSKFKENKNESDPAKIEESIKIAEEADNFIRNHIVQGTFTEGTDSLKLKIPKNFPQNSVLEPIDKVRIK